jgi:integrase
MAHLGQKNGVYHLRFRFKGREFKKSVKVRSADEASAALHLVEVTLHRLRTSQLLLPEGVEPGDFIMSGGTLTAPTQQTVEEVPTSSELIAEYLTSQRPRLAVTYHGCQQVHLRHWENHLGSAAQAPCTQVGVRDLERFLEHRLGERHPTTVEHERTTLMQLYKWATQQGHFQVSPAAALRLIKGAHDRPAFRTYEEIEAIRARGGLDEEQETALWDCLFLTPTEIAGLLQLVRNRSRSPLSLLLHALPAYTGMRRGEVLRLRWLDVDFERGHITARSRKQSRQHVETARHIDLHPELTTLLTAWRAERPRGQWVLCDDLLQPLGSHKANRLFWRPLRGTTWCLDTEKNWFKIGFHTYRHSFASNLAAQGVDQRVIDEFMGHTTEAMRRRYRHLFPSA